ncbi:MAG: 2-isopropylmalate synthase [Puniceicoccales bacterium]|jgi:2-isopropylmalate synthase|nr:2-isopropylmalate synthase [Puniceicoccales bacterium]
MQHAPITKYHPQAGIELAGRRWPSRTITLAPAWCSVDLRDGNQALAIPMNVPEKIEMFNLLVRVGFKEIEIGFPSASDTEFAFCRELVARRLVPDDVTVQVLVQCREHLIRRTFDALEGFPRAIVHIYNSTSPLQRRVTFGGATRAGIKQIAVEGARLVKAAAGRFPGLRLEYSPESFSDTEPDFALEVCEAVGDVWQPTREAPIIFNLPETVQWAMPNHYADRIEWFVRHLASPETAIVSLHTHNDRGTGTAATELGLLAGATRVEGTLFGNGERTGNLDIVNLALNLYSNGVDPGLDFSDLPSVRAIYERCTRMSVHERHPYAGDLVFTAFSGSHQDAIKKGMDLRAGLPKDAPWAVPYLTIDPRDIGTDYEAVIRINSQSGKGGVAYILARDHSLNLPKEMHPQVGATINSIADAAQRDLSPAEIYENFHKNYVNLDAPLDVSHIEHNIVGADPGSGAEIIHLRAEMRMDGGTGILEGDGNGPLNALVNALERRGLKDFSLVKYESHSFGATSAASAAAYVCLRRARDGALFWGCGLHTSIETAGIRALVSAYNRAASL